MNHLDKNLTTYRGTYRGQDLETMTKLQLIQAVVELGHLYEQAVKQHIDDLRSIGEMYE